MKTLETPQEKFRRMTETPIPKLIVHLAIPTIISMMITSIYNMADTFFVGQIGTSATGAVGVAFSLMAIIQAIGFTFGAGSGNYISRLLGQQRHEEAERIAATGFFTALIAGLILAVAGELFLEPLVRILGATETILPYAMDYIRWILVGAPYMMACFVLNNILRYQGSSFYSMLGVATGGILNIALDPLFIYAFNLGTAGAAIATIISQFVSFCILLHHSRRPEHIHIKFRMFTPTWAVYKEILRGGLPSFYRQGLGSLATISLNFAAHPYGDAAIAAMSIVNRIFQFIHSVQLGFGQGFQPVCGFNYGAGRYDRVLEGFWFCIKVSVGILCVLSLVGFIFAPQIIPIFRRDADVIAIGTLAMRLQCVAFPLNSWVVMNNMLCQTIGKGTAASLLSIARQGMFFIPIILIFPSLFGLLGVQMGQPCADVCSFLLAIPIGARVLRELKAGPKNTSVAPSGESSDAAMEEKEEALS